MPFSIEQGVNKISTDNGRVASTLAASATYQGTSEDVSKYGRAGISIFSDNSTDGALTVEVSHDNSLWKSVTRDWSDTSSALPHMWTIVEKYFRIKYVNGTTEATNLSIQVQLSINSDISLSHPTGGTIPAETETVVTRLATSFLLDAARLHINGQSADFFFGHNHAVGTSYEDISPQGGDYPWPLAAAKVAISSSHAADTAAGLGCQSVEIHGLSATGVDQSEVIATNGTTEVESALSYVRLSLLHNEEVGTYGGSHRGDITCRVTSSGAKTGDILSMMTGDEGAVDSSVKYGYGESQNGFTSVPLGKVIYITRVEVIPNIGSNKTVSVALYEREGILTVADPFLPRRVIWSAEEFDSPIEKEFQSHIKIKALTDLYFRAKGSATSKIEVWCDFYLVDANSVGA